MDPIPNQIESDQILSGSTLYVQGAEASSKHEQLLTNNYKSSEINQQPQSQPSNGTNENYQQPQYLPSNENFIEQNIRVVEIGNSLDMFLKTLDKQFSAFYNSELLRNHENRKIQYSESNQEYKLDKFGKEENDPNKIQCGILYNQVCFWKCPNLDLNNISQQEKIPILFRIFQHLKKDMPEYLNKDNNQNQAPNNQDQEMTYVLHNIKEGIQFQIKLDQKMKDEMKVSNKYEIFSDCSLVVLKALPQLNEDSLFEMIQNIMLMKLSNNNQLYFFDKEAQEYEKQLKKLIESIEDDIAGENQDRKQQMIEDIAQFKGLVLKYEENSGFVKLKLPMIKLQILEQRENKESKVYFIGDKTKFKIGRSENNHVQMNNELFDKFNLEVEFTRQEKDVETKWYISNDNITKVGYSIQYSIWKVFDCLGKDQLYYEFKNPGNLFRIQKTEFLFQILRSHKSLKQGGQIYNYYFHQEGNVDMEDEASND